MSFENYLEQQLFMHPSMQQQDLLKLCYQAAFGAEHLIENLSAARKAFEDEFNSVSPENIPLFEQISDETVRVNLAAWKYRKLNPDWLFNIFSDSARIREDGAESFEKYLDVCCDKTSQVEWKLFIEKYKARGLHPVHHSEIYRYKEKPFYRVVDERFTRIFPILEACTKLDVKPCVIAIEGRAASGKSSLADYLTLALDADIVHMDDFFLPPELRTEERLREAGGNIHYERFKEEVLPKIKSEDSFYYNVFSCSSMNFAGKSVINNEKFRIVEGVYSLHPLFGDYADIKVFTSIDFDNQMARILKRNGKELAEMFESVWIPMEEKYFSEFKIAEKCSIFL